MQSIVGTFTGDCTNQSSIGGKASIRLIIYSQEGSHIRGELTIFGDLDGGSQFDGVYAESTVSFTTRSHGGKLVITWTGKLAEDAIEGSYDVDDRRLIQYLTSFGFLRTQKGIWKCKKEGA